MTISTENTRNDYLGNGATANFPYTFKVFASSDLRVYLDGVLQTIATHYTVSGVGADAGGNVTFLTAPADQAAVAIVADIAFTQTTDLVNETRFFQSRIEDRFDRLCRQIQTVSEVNSRTVRLPYDEAGSEALTVLPSASDRAGKTLGFDAITKQPVMYSTSSTAVSTAMEPVVQAATIGLASDAFAFSATGGTTARSMRDRAADVISVKEFGAVGDGVADDTSAIQSAFDTSICVFIPEGVYKTSAPLLLRNNCHITGAGWRNTIIYNPTTTGMKRKEVGDARDFYLADFQIAANNDSVNNLIGLDFMRVNYSTVINVCARFYRTGVRLARVEGGIGNCYFNTFYSLKTLSNQTGLLLEDDGTGVVCNKNTFFDTFYEDVGVWTGSNGIDLSGYGNSFFGIYSGHSGGNSCLKLRAISGNNHIHSFYGESSATYLIDNSADTSLRKNFVYGTHIDSGTMVKLARTADTDLFINDRDGQRGCHLLDSLAASDTGYRFVQNVAVAGTEPYVDLASSAGGGKRFRMLSGGGGIGGAGYFILHEYASGRNPVGIKHDTEQYAILADADGVAIKKLKTDVIATASLPVAGATMDGRIVIEDAGAGNRNLIVYAGGQRFRIDGGANV